MYSPTLTHIQQEKVTLSQTTHTQPKKGLTHSHPAKNGQTHPQPPTPIQRKVTLTDTQPKKKSYSPTPIQTRPKNGHTQPYITERKNAMCSILFSQY